MTIDSIAVTTDDLPELNMRLISSRQIFSLTAPAEPKSISGRRDRWWLYGDSGKTLILSYWIFESPEDAMQAVTKGIYRITARRLSVHNGRESMYQPETESEWILGDNTWRDGSNILFVKDRVVVLVRESGKNISLTTTRNIALEILEKIEEILS